MRGQSSKSIFHSLWNAYEGHSSVGLKTREYNFIFKRKTNFIYNLYLSGSPACVEYKLTSIKHKLSRKYAS